MEKNGMWALRLGLERRTSTLLLLLVICRLISSVGTGLNQQQQLRSSSLALEEGSMETHVPGSDDETVTDFGNMMRSPASAVLRPRSVDAVAELLKAVQSSDGPLHGLSVTARGHGHSVQGQSLSWPPREGAVVCMESLSGDMVVNAQQSYVDVNGGHLWIDVLHATLRFGLAPRSWTDYLYLSVGGTLSNAGISGQAFRHGPQISNVRQLQVVTGSGRVVQCSKHENADLFHAVLGGLGQFGIITRARIDLEPAPQRVRWIRVLYWDLDTFMRDQEYLISRDFSSSSSESESATFDYVEGFVIVNNAGLLSNWRSSFFSPQNPVKVSNIDTKGRVLYCIEMTKNYFLNQEEEEEEDSVSAVDAVVDSLLAKLSFIPNTVFTSDTSYVEFLDRVHASELKLRAKGLWHVPHPWLNLLIPRSSMAQFGAGVFQGILRNTSSGPILIYPMNRDRWDNRTSAVIPDDDVFYLVALLRSAVPTSNSSSPSSLKSLQEENQKILEFCRKHNIGEKQYLPHYDTQADWQRHFGHKWKHFLQRKRRYDPNAVLSPGQRIFPAHKTLMPLNDHEQL